MNFGTFILGIVSSPNFPAIIEIIAALIAAMTTIKASYLSRKNQLSFENRKIKQEIYLSYVDAISAVGNTGKNTDVTEKLRNDNQWVDAHNRLLLVACSKIVDAMYEFEDYANPNYCCQFKLTPFKSAPR